MEKQNKIYATVQGANLLGCSTKPYRYCEEFIRKDALLEWAEHTINDGASGDDYELGYQHALLELIDKLNSM